MLAMVPHVIWLKQVNFLPFTYAASSYSISGHAQVLELALGYIGHNLALLAVPVVLAAVALAWDPRWWALPARRPLAFVARPWWRVNRGPVRGAGDKRMDHPDRSRDRAAARCTDFRHLYQDRLGNPNVLPNAAGVDRDPDSARA